MTNPSKSLMTFLASIAATALPLAVSNAATTQQSLPFASQGTALAVEAPLLFARRGADDAPGHIRNGRSADDPAGHGKRGADDVPGHGRRGADDLPGHGKRGADDPAGHGKRGADDRSRINGKRGADDLPGDPRGGHGADDPVGHG